MGHVNRLQAAITVQLIHCWLIILKRMGLKLLVLSELRLAHLHMYLTSLFGHIALVSLALERGCRYWKLDLKQSKLQHMRKQLTCKLLLADDTLFGFATECPGPKVSKAPCRNSLVSNREASESRHKPFHETPSPLWVEHSNMIHMKCAAGISAQQ